MPISLRPYQEEAVDAVRNSLRLGKKRPLLVLSTGGGKTVCFSYITDGAMRKGKKVWILAHRAELLDQISASLSMMQVPHGMIAAGRTPDPLQSVQVCSVQTLVRRLESTQVPDLMVVDECFVSGTLVDGVPIDQIKIGDSISTHNGKGFVTHVFKKKPESLLTVKLSDGNTFTCTEDHPVWNQNGFVAAKDLMRGDVMATIMQYGMLNLRRTDEREKTLREKGVQVGTLKEDYQEYIPQASRADNEVQENEWDARSQGEGAGFDKASSNELETCQTRGQWPRPNDSRACFSCGSRMADERSCANRIARTRLSNLLQDRCGEFNIEGCCGGGWVQSCGNIEEASGQEEGAVFNFVRVESVEIHKQTSCGTFGGMCSDGFVYNLEVSNGNTYFANGVLVHNCHHGAAGSWMKILKTFPSARVLGVTATPERLDGKGLGVVFDDLIQGVSMQWLIENGYLCKPVYYAPSTINTSGMRKTAGDFNKADIERETNKPTITGCAVEHYRKICDGVPAVAFCSSIRHAEAVAAQFNAAGYRFAVIEGRQETQQRRELVRKLGSGELHGLTSCDIISEGFDLPVVTAAILLRPTSSLSLYLQQVGRVLRPHASKTNAIILDHVGNVLRHGFAEDEREWSLEGSVKRKKKEKDAIPNRQCPACYGIHRPLPVCPLCGHEYVIQSREAEHVDGELKELNRDEVKALEKRKQGAARSLVDLIRLGRERGYKSPERWAAHILNARGVTA